MDNLDQRSRFYWLGEDSPDPKPQKFGFHLFVEKGCQNDHW